MSIDFDTLITDGDSFVGTSNDMSDYKKWAARQVCEHCGEKAADRIRNFWGAVISGSWLTEVDCGCQWRKDDPDSEMTKEWQTAQEKSQRYMTSERYLHQPGYWKTKE